MNSYKIEDSEYGLKLIAKGPWDSGLSAAASEQRVKHLVLNTAKKYIGQSKELARRIAQHIYGEKLVAEQLDTVVVHEVLGGKDIRREAEQALINANGGKDLLDNKINAVRQ